MTNAMLGPRNQATVDPAQPRKRAAHYRAAQGLSYKSVNYG